jgi:hypothetical protein
VYFILGDDQFVKIILLSYFILLNILNFNTKLYNTKKLPYGFLCEKSVLG